MKPAVGMIGLGLMGKPMAANLLKAGFSLVVWNRTGAKAEELVRAGAKLTGTPREAAAASDVLLTIVSDPPALEAVLWGDMGALGGLRRGSTYIDSSTVAGLRRGSTYIDSSTVAPALARRIAAACAERGVEFLDAPVTGGTWGASSTPRSPAAPGAPRRANWCSW